MAAVLAGMAQAVFVGLDARNGAPFELGPLFPNLIVGAASCILVAAVTYWATGPHDTGALSFLGHAGSLGLLSSFCWFEAGYFFSRFPAISDVDLCLSLRPWPRILPGCVIPFAVTLLLASLPDNRVELANPFRAPPP